MPSGVHDSALIVNAFRARKIHISADKFAALWISPESDIWANKYAEQVGSTEILVHALRHRFFLECLNKFFDKSSDGVFINIGAGFTNYPYLISLKIPCCEIDTEVNIKFKQQKLAEFELKGNFPYRQLQFITVNDLNDLPEISHLELVLREWIGDRSSFILFEGVFFYLKIEAIGHFYRMLAALQQRGDIVASTSFRPEECNKLMFQRLVDYCRTDYKMRNFTPTTISTSFYSQQSNYSLVTHKNYYSLCQEFALAETLENPEEVLEEDCYVLERL
ncbi:MAG: class I SAM-dependent methyltransferase [Aulosira sp. ZfuVER01]|nr:class I SAM-dependent methyltransferase [Aulosira sp. ZfuVER01]MDZ7997682.1 class I SAM-dependent methyltransferase [Aulosira sp. DedVER01a]MDZ8055335.1 class I SAM-dependent methyltransferase [Aulosira sp. ZfuCHP01]